MNASKDIAQADAAIAADVAPKAQAPEITLAGEAPKIEAPAIEAVKAETADPIIHRLGEIPKVKTSVVPARNKRFTLLAASIAVAAALGSIIGAVAGVALARQTPEMQSSDGLRGTLQQLRAELSSMKVALENNGKNTNTQFNKLAERVERTEKAQSEPAAKLARIAEAVERLDKKPSAAIPGAAPIATAPADVTGSIAEKSAPRNAVLGGWVLREIYDGRALIESRNGLYEVGPGSNLPGLGRIEGIKRQDGRWVVVTPKGLIVSAR